MAEPIPILQGPFREMKRFRDEMSRDGIAVDVMRPPGSKPNG